MSTPTAVSRFDLRDLPADYYDDPYPHLRTLRAREPIYRCPDGSWFLTRHADLNQVYRQPRLFSSDKQAQFAPLFGPSPLYDHHTTSLVFNDPPLHTQVRKAIGDALSPRTVASLAPALEVLVDELIERIAEQGQCDLMRDFAAPIPIEVIGNLLAIRRSDRGSLQRWSNAILGALEFGGDAGVQSSGNRALVEFVDFLRQVLADRRARPGEDIISRLLRHESDGFRLSEFQILHQCIFLLNAGHETTTNLIGNGLLALVRHPDQLARLRREPSLIDSAVEECLRYEAPVQLGNRTVAAATRLGAIEFAGGEFLTLSIGAANRDPEVFARPDAFDIARTPNPHLAFGSGIHTCAGLAVARLEARIAIGRFVTRFSRIELSGPVVRARRARFRAIDALPLSCRS